jgi:hypothetical protein
MIMLESRIHLKLETCSSRVDTSPSTPIFLYYPFLVTKTGHPLSVEEAGSEKKNFVFSAGGGCDWGGDGTAVPSAKTNPTMAAASKNRPLEAHKRPCVLRRCIRLIAEDPPSKWICFWRGGESVTGLQSAPLFRQRIITGTKERFEGHTPLIHTRTLSNLFAKKNSDSFLQA